MDDLKIQMLRKNRDEGNNMIQEGTMVSNSGFLRQSEVEDPLIRRSSEIGFSSPKRTVRKKTASKVEGQKITKVKDELEYATNWRRAINKVFTHLKWLNSYAKINYIASMKYDVFFHNFIGY
jgi:hypothetical protein